MRWSPVTAIDDSAVNDLLSRVVLVIAHNADFDRRFLERRLPVSATKHWACSRFDIDWKAEGIRSSALEFVAYSLGFFHDGHRAASDCRATLHTLAQPLPATGRLALQTLLKQARLPTWRLWARDAAIEKKMSSRRAVTPGAPESSGDRNAGIGTWRTPIGRQKCRGSGKM